MIDLFKRNFYIYFVVASCSLSFTCLGSSVSWASPSLVKLRLPDSPIPVTNSEASWIGSFIAIGACMVAIPYMMIFNRVGRKSIIVITACLYVSGWLVMNVATTVFHIYIARFLMGCAVGPTYGVVPTYLAEVVSKNVRGSNMAILLIAQSVGTFSQFITGPILTLETNNAISLCIPLLFLICSLFIPESPYYLAGKEDFDKSSKVVMRLRGAKILTNEIAEELSDIKKCLSESESVGTFEFLKKMTQWNTFKVFFIIVLITFCQQFSGSGPIIVYLESIFRSMGSLIEPKYAVIITEALSDITVFIAMMFINRIGRKTVISIASTMCIFANITLGLSFYLKYYEIINVSWLGMFSVFLFQMGMGLGLSSVPFLIMSEIMSYDLKSWMSGFYQVFQGLFNATAIKMFQIVSDSFGDHCAYWMFAVTLLFGLLTLLLIVPETRGKSLAEIQDILNNGKNVESSKKVPFNCLLSENDTVHRVLREKA